MVSGRRIGAANDITWRVVCGTELEVEGHLVTEQQRVLTDGLQLDGIVRSLHHTHQRTRELRHAPAGDLGLEVGGGAVVDVAEAAHHQVRDRHQGAVAEQQLAEAVMVGARHREGRSPVASGGPGTTAPSSIVHLTANQIRQAARLGLESPGHERPDVGEAFIGERRDAHVVMTDVCGCLHGCHRSPSASRPGP